MTEILQCIEAEIDIEREWRGPGWRIPEGVIEVTVSIDTGGIPKLIYGCFEGLRWRCELQSVVRRGNQLVCEYLLSEVRE